MRRVLAVAVSFGVVLGAASVATAAQATPQAATSTIAWGVCADLQLQIMRAQCGYLSVPLDRRRPREGTIQIAVSRIRHTVAEAEYQGILLVNPGGPGGSGLALPALVANRVPKGAGAAYDWIGFDPRGVGASKPALACDSTYFGYDRPPYVPTPRSIEATWLAKAKGYARACDEAGGRLLDHVKTTDTVNDMDAIRRALGEPKLNLYGFSYGTLLGQVYSTLYPSNVRRMVLDGIVDPRGVWYQANLAQDTAFDHNIKILFGWIAQHDDLYRLGTTADEVEAAYYAAQRRLIAEPAAGVIGPAEWNDLFVSAGYTVRAWPAIAALFAGWVIDGDAAALKAAFDASFPTEEGSDNGYAMYLATQCTDAQWPTSFRTWRRDNDRIHPTAPFLTWNNAWYNAPCLTWGARAGRPVAVDGNKAPGVLLISETLDAATPFVGALEVRSRFPKSSLVEGVGGTTHSSSLRGGPCVDDAVADYLLTGALPQRIGGRQSDRKCAALPQPQPQPTVFATRAETTDLTELDRLTSVR